MSEEKKILHCSFCGKSQHDVKKLIAGPEVFICDECIELCADIVDEVRDGPVDRLLSRLNDVPELASIRELTMEELLGTLAESTDIRAMTIVEFQRTLRTLLQKRVQTVAKEQMGVLRTEDVAVATELQAALEAFALAEAEQQVRQAAYAAATERVAANAARVQDAQEKSRQIVTSISQVGEFS